MVARLPVINYNTGPPTNKGKSKDGFTSKVYLHSGRSRGLNLLVMKVVFNCQPRARTEEDISNSRVTPPSGRKTDRA